MFGLSSIGMLQRLRTQSDSGKSIPTFIKIKINKKEEVICINSPQSHDHVQISSIIVDIELKRVCKVM